MLHRICRKFLEDRLITMEQEKEDSLVVTTGPFQVMYTHNTAIDLELFSVDKPPESSVVIARDTVTKENELAISIAKGCLPDYLTLLQHARYPFCRYVQKRFEPYHQQAVPADMVLEEIFPQCSYLAVMHLLRTFYPTTKQKII